MHNPPPPSPPQQPPAFNMESIDDHLTSILDWSQFLDFNIDDDQLPLPIEEPDHSPAIPISQEVYPIDNTQVVTLDSGSDTNDRVRKRDPRMACSNFLAGRIPCACPEEDALLVAEEEAATRKKKTRMITARTPASCRCQVPGCEVDISGLKGYHKRHRVCLQCATASTVVFDDQNKRYCQQCGKFHMLSDFDEGKRSCRRKLERHNNRRRRKPSEAEGSGLQSVDYDDGLDEAKPVPEPTGSELAGENPFLAAEGHIGNLPSSINAQTIQSENIPSLAVSGENQTDEEKEKGIQSPSPSICDDKSAFSSVYPTGRISFKLYDWNPAEFPRRLRHQIMQWLDSMPVELEDYIRPGCTIITIFIAMPRSMWLKLSEDPVVCIHDLLSSPRNLLSGRDTFFVNLNSMIFSVMKGGRSVVRIKAGDKSPKLHYVQPTCFEAGKPIEFLACGSNLFQPRLRFLVSFAGKYMTNDWRVSSFNNKNETCATSFDHQFMNICVPHTELDVFGPGFIEVENEFGLSNFIPILIAEEEICSEIKIMQKKYYSNLQFTTNSCEIAVNKFSELLVDIAWLLKQPVAEDDMMSSQLQRFDHVISFLIEYESTTVLKRILHSLKMKIDKNGGILEETVNHATQILNQRLEEKLNINLQEKDNLVEDDDDDDQVLPFISNINQESEKVGLLNADHVMSVTPYKEQPEMRSNRMFAYRTNRFMTGRALILAVGLVTVCFGVCAAMLHPQKATAIAITIHRCLFDDN